MPSSLNPAKYQQEFHNALLAAHERFSAWHRYYLDTGDLGDLGDTQLYHGTRREAIALRTRFLGLLTAWEHTRHPNAQIAIDLTLLIRGPNDWSATTKLGDAIADQPVWRLFARPRSADFLRTQGADFVMLSHKWATERANKIASQPAPELDPTVFSPAMRQDIADQMIKDLLAGKPIRRTEPAPPSEEEKQAQIAKLYEIPDQSSPGTIDNAAAPRDTPVASQNDAEPNPTLKEPSK